MKTHNWQTKALTLFIAAVALWLATACGNAYTNNEIPLAKEATETPTREATDTPADEDSGQQTGCTTESTGLTSRLNISDEEYQDYLRKHSIAGGVLYRYQSLLWRQPNVYDVIQGFFRDDEGRWTGMWGITVWVTERVDQNALPTEDRLPDYLEGVRIRIVEAKPELERTESSCDYSMCGVNLEKGEVSMTNPNENTLEERARRQALEQKVRDRYEPLFWRQPNVHSTSIGLFLDENDERTGHSGIIVSVTRKVDQSTLPPEDRIPDCLEGIPVHIEEREPFMGVQANRVKERTND